MACVPSDAGAVQSCVYSGHKILLCRTQLFLPDDWIFGTEQGSHCLSCWNDRAPACSPGLVDPYSTSTPHCAQELNDFGKILGCESNVLIRLWFQHRLNLLLIYAVTELRLCKCRSEPFLLLALINCPSNTLLILGIDRTLAIDLV